MYFTVFHWDNIKMKLKSRHGMISMRNSCRKYILKKLWNEIPLEIMAFRSSKHTTIWFIKYSENEKNIKNASKTLTAFMSFIIPKKIKNHFERNKLFDLKLEWDQAYWNFLHVQRSLFIIHSQYHLFFGLTWKSQHQYNQT